jgi:hypothetical protein
MTNKEKFKEVFGFIPCENLTDSCPLPFKACSLTDGDCDKCPFNKWWDKEYKDCFTLREDLND